MSYTLCKKRVYNRPLYGAFKNCRKRSYILKVVRDLCPTSSAENRNFANINDFYYTNALISLPFDSVFIFVKRISVSKQRVQTLSG